MTDKEPCHVEPVVKQVDQSAVKNAAVAFLAVSGMGCQRCAMRVRTGLLILKGVYKAEIYLEDHLAEVTFNPQVHTPEDLLNAVAAAGNVGHHRYWGQLVQVEPAQSAR